MSHINDSMSSRNDSMMFVTLFVGALDLSTGELQYSNAGHNAPVVISDSNAHFLEVDSNVSVGVVKGQEYSLQKLTLSPDTILFLYTDGLTEATRSDGQMFGEKRVLERLSGYGNDFSVEKLISQMSDDVRKFVGDAEQSDDLTMLAIEVLLK